MTIITNEMKDNADKFIIRWRGITSEKAEAQTFTNEFFQVFDLDRKNLAQFEKPILRKDGLSSGFADLFWSGKLLIEFKSAHLDNTKNWENTLQQAVDYIETLFDHQKPQYILLINFRRFRIHKVEKLKSGKVNVGEPIDIPMENLSENLEQFSFFVEFANQLESDEEKVNQEAARRIANVYDAIERKGYSTEDIAVLLSRIMFCLFAEDTGIFERKQFENYISEHTDGNNLGDKLLSLFNILNTPKEKRNADDILNNFPYANGGLFDSKLNNIPQTNDGMRKALLECCNYDWSDISPVIFGSLFQAVVHNEDRRSLGAHYTSEKNIMRVIKPLFLDELRDEFEKAKSSESKIDNFRRKLSDLYFLDPACGCGNFLVITYRELRLLDIELIRTKKMDLTLDINMLNYIHLDHFYGYEIERTSSMIAEVAMWLTQHQMNIRLESEFGRAVPTIPLHEAAKIENCNALHKEWQVEKKGEEQPIFDYIFGNPPFIGSKMMTQANRDDVVNQFENITGSGVLDYVTAWYAKAAKYIIGQHTKVAFVSTNSISQGEQVSILWHYLINKYKVKIHFAHRTFKWSNEAKNNAAVYCVIVGFANFDTNNKTIYDYNDIKGEPIPIKAKNINPYLVDSKDVFILKSSNPICNVPKMIAGNVAYDYGHFMFTPEEMNDFIQNEPNSGKYFRRVIGGTEMINRETRHCLWLKGINPSELRLLKNVLEKVKKVKEQRLNAKDKGTHRLAERPHEFRDLNNPKSFIAIPKTSSENRKYIPIDFFNDSFIPVDSLRIVENGTIYHFGVLTSTMHMAWVRYTCGRLESRYRYSKDIVYNNYPWPSQEVGEAQKQAIETAAQNILDIRAEYPDSSLADLYDPVSMPQKLLKAHQELDKLVDKLYRDKPFRSEPERIEFLFELYDKYTAGMFPAEKKKRGKK